MGRNKQLRKRLASLEARIAEHHQKIADEWGKPEPNIARIRYWYKEIAGREKEVE